MYVILVKQEYMQSSTYSLQKVSNTHKEQSSPWRTLMLFLDMRRYKNWAHQISSWKYQTVLRLVLPVFPRAHNTSFLLSILNSLQGYLKSAVIPAYDLILVEVDGKCQFVFDMINISFFFFKRVLLPLSFGNLHVFGLGCRPWIATLCFSSMFAKKYLSVYLNFRSTFQWAPQGPEKTPNSSRAGVQTGPISSFESLLFTVFLTNPGVWRMFYSWDWAFTLFVFEALLPLFGIY